MAVETVSQGTSRLNPRQRMLARKSALWSERSEWEAHWREILDYQHPTLGRFTLSDTNKGHKDKRRNIIDNTAVFASRTLAAGMMSGMTSPARPWFRLQIQDPELREREDVKDWLHATTQKILAIFNSSNTYRALHQCYVELGLVGTWASVVQSDFNNVIHHHNLTAGEYALATDDRGFVDTMYRETRMRVSQVVEKFGYGNVSNTVKNLYDRGSLDTTVDVVHAIEPRRDRDPTKLDAQNKAWKSVYFEPSQDNHDKFLRNGGYDFFPVLAPRWMVVGNDVYGDSPGAECKGDVKQLQQEQLRKGQGIDYQSNPPLQVPTSYKGGNKGRLPGGIMYVDQTSPSNAIRSAFDVPLDLNHLLADISDIRNRVNQTYYADLFLLLANDTRSGVTATEIAERHEEKLLMLGPVLERLHNELLKPKIEMTMHYAEQAGILPEPPEDIQGMELNIDFVSVLAQAQRAVAVSGMDRLLGVVGQTAELFPEVRHKVDVNRMVDVYGEAFGIDPGIIRANRDAEQRQQSERQQQQAQEAAMAAQQSAETASTASQVDTENMSEIMRRLQGFGLGGGPGNPTGGLGPGSGL